MCIIKTGRVQSPDKTAYTAEFNEVKATKEKELPLIHEVQKYEQSKLPR